MHNTIQHRHLPLLLLQARETLMSHFRPILNHTGLTEQQWRVLRTLYERGQLEPRDICDACQILSPSLAGILKRMEEMGLVQRYPVPADKRRVLIGLTDKSRELVDQIAPIVTEQYQLIADAFGQELIDKLQLTLDDLVAKQDTTVKMVDVSKLPVLDHNA